jgi:hypothetical protein
LTTDSDAEFSLYPRKGELNSSLGEPTVFYVSFTPIAYGKEKLVKTILLRAKLL